MSLLMMFLACEQQEPAYTIPKPTSAVPRPTELVIVKRHCQRSVANRMCFTVGVQTAIIDPTEAKPSNCAQISGPPLKGELIPMQVTVSGGGGGALMIDISQGSETLMKLDCAENRVAKFNVSVDWLRLTFKAIIGSESGSYNDITPSLEDNTVEIEIGRDTLEPWFGPDGVDDPEAEPALPPPDAPPPPPPPPENEPPSEPVDERTQSPSYD